MTMKHAGPMDRTSLKETYIVHQCPKTACSRTVISCTSEKLGATNGSQLPLISGNLFQTPRVSTDLLGGHLSVHYLLDKRGMLAWSRREFFLQTEGTTAHLLCLGSLRLFYRRNEGGGWRVKRVPYPRIYLSTGAQRKQNFDRKNNDASGTSPPTRYQVPVRASSF